MTLFRHPFRRRKRRGQTPGCQKRHCREVHSDCLVCPLSDIPVGRGARVYGFDEHLPAYRSAQLQAYGLAPGYQVRVLQHSPVTVIQVEHVELALEGDLARMVMVEAIG